MDYLKVYKAANSNEAHFIKGLLQNNSLDVKLLGENLSVAMGGLPLEVIQVDILIHKDDYEQAKAILQNYENKIKSTDNSKKWICKHCSNHNPGSFEICWNCNK